MAVLSVTGFGEVPVARGGWTEAVERVGDYDRAFSGKARSSVRYEYHVWTVQTVEMALSDAESLRDALLATAPIAVTGDGPGSVNVVPQGVRLVMGSDGSDLIASVSFELHEDEP